MYATDEKWLAIKNFDPSVFWYVSVYYLCLFESHCKAISIYQSICNITNPTGITDSKQPGELKVRKKKGGKEHGL